MLDRLLDPIYKTQQQLDQNAHHNLREYTEKAHKHVQSIAKAAGVTLTYGTRTGGYEVIQQPVPQPKKESSDVLVTA